ncbi:TIGR02678 family protein [Streptomyces sp. wa1063]|uniref:TIGR02678 family protein n=1 Tax=Streptomyces sp. wa1063 TaxID=1828212 RepID=UPI00211D4EA1|nr:TIGR02678 family protein [Streptomyces sp. wa1063]
MTTPPAEVLDGQRAAELRKAARALLKQPLLLSHGKHADEFRLVRRHAAELREWFDRNTGWPLHVDAGTARLRKIPGVLHDSTHPAREATRAAAPFTRRRYVLLCLALAALERGESQIALGRLADQVVLDATDPGLVASASRRRLRMSAILACTSTARMGRSTSSTFPGSSPWRRCGCPKRTTARATRRV